MQQTNDKNQQPKCLPAGGQALKRPALADITNNLTEPSTKGAKYEQADTNLGPASGQNILAKQETVDEKANSDMLAFFADDQADVQPPAQDDVTNNARQQPSTVAKSDQDDNSLHSASEILHDRPQSLPDLTQTEATDHVDNHPCAAALSFPAIPQPSSSEKAPMLLDNSNNQEASVNTDETPPLSLMVNRDVFITNTPEYAEDIYKHLLSIEHKHKVKPGFMLKQHKVTLLMRAVLVNWLSQVAGDNGLCRETLFLTVNYIDRFLSVMAVKRSKLQLVGVAAMYLATKYEEVCPITMPEFIYITAGTYTKKQILYMERILLKVLEFNLSPPTISWFSERALTYSKARVKPRFLSMYLTELVLVDMDNYLQYPNSLVAAAALCLANIILGAEEPWPEHCVQITYYTLEELKPCLKKMNRLHRDAKKFHLQGIREKYKHVQFQRIALLPSPSVLNI